MGGKAMNKWIWPSVVALLMCCIAVMQKEIVDLQSRADPAAAIQKFERDFFSRLNAEGKARAAQQAVQDAQWNAAVTEGLRGLPTKDLDKPAMWPER
jgi:hypothetical protein